jgi:dihydrofolate synthase / folylpolyglutamate synthase
MTYREAVARVTGLRGGEMAGMRPGLERIETLLEAIGHPERAMTLVQVAGTNGKGSVCAMLAAILEASERRVGLYTSPHLVDIRERIRVAGRPISEVDFADGVEALGTLVARLDATMFEALTALALDHFAREGVEVGVLEVGLGGRLDSTTVGRPAVELITRIDFDHQAYLGDTLAAIAAEKAAIIRSGTAVSAAQAPEAERVIVERAAEAGVPLLLEGRELRARVRQRGIDGQRLDLEGPGFRLDDVRVALLGVFQPGNALLAAAAAHALGVEAAAIGAGLGSARWPGRFQVLRGDPTIVLDGAHNPAGARALAASLEAYFPGRRATFVIAILADKDQAGILTPLLPLAQRVIFTGTGHPRAAAATSLKLLAGRLRPELETAIADSPAEALQMALAGASTPMVCVTGSLSLLGPILVQATEKTDIFSGSDPFRC